MQKRDFSNSKLPKITYNNDTPSSKLYSLTGLRVFQAKFMEDLRYPRQQLKLGQTAPSNNQNSNTIPLSKPLELKDNFTGKNKINEAYPQLAKTIDVKNKDDAASRVK